MAIARHPHHCFWCGELMEEIHHNRGKSFIGDTFGGYKEHTCDSVKKAARQKEIDAELAKPSPQSEQAGEKVETLHPEQEKQYPILLEDFGKDFLNALDFMQDYSGDKAKLRVAANTIMQIADGSIRYLCPALWQAASQEKGVRWVVSNERRPEKQGFYYCEDSAGNKTMVHFYNNHWHSLTNHPVSKWLDESPAPDTVQGQEDNWKEVEETIRLAIGLDPYRSNKIVDYLQSKFTLTKNS